MFPQVTLQRLLFPCINSNTVSRPPILMLAGPLAFALFIHRYQILPEESMLEAKFGPEYIGYRRRVRRWL